MWSATLNLHGVAWKDSIVLHEGNSQGPIMWSAMLDLVHGVARGKRYECLHDACMQVPGLSLLLTHLLGAQAGT